jgi:hypothetical protein
VNRLRLSFRSAAAPMGALVYKCLPPPLIYSPCGIYCKFSSPAHQRPGPNADSQRGVVHVMMKKGGMLCKRLQVQCRCTIQAVRQTAIVRGPVHTFSLLFRVSGLTLFSLTTVPFSMIALFFAPWLVPACRLSCAAALCASFCSWRWSFAYSCLSRNHSVLQ